MSGTGKINRIELGFFAAIFGALLCAVVSATFMIPRLKMTYSLKQFLPPNHPLLKADDETRKRFFLDESQPVLVTLDLQDGDWMETENLKRLEAATSAFTGREHVLNALSLGSISLASQTPNELKVGKLLELPDAKARRTRVARDRFLSPILISKNLKSTLVVISVEESVSTAFVDQLIADVRTTFAKEIPRARIAVGGVPAIQTRLTTMVRTELSQFMSLALIASCMTLLLVFSSLWSAIVPFFAIIIANVFVLAFMAWAGISMTVLAVTIPILVSIAVLSLCAHTMLRFVEEAHRSRGIPRYAGMTVKGSLVFETLAALFSTNLLTSIITCFGFATLLITKVPVIREFGFTVAVSVMISWISTTAILAPMLAVLPVPVARRWVLREASWVGLVFEYRRGIILVVSVVCMSMAILGQRLHWSARLFDDLPAKEEARTATERIDRGLGGTIPFEILVERAGVTDPWNEPDSLRRLDSVLAKIRKYSEVGSAVGLPDVLRQGMGNPVAKIPQKRAAIAESWFLLSMAGENPLKQFLTADGATARLAIRLRDMPADRLSLAMESMVQDVAKVFPKAKVTTGGMATTVHVLNNELSRHLLEGFFHALGVITLLLFVVFRSGRWTLTAVLPNLVPATILVGVLALTATPIKPGVALVFSIALGIAFINTVYLLFRVRDLMKETGEAAHEVIERALRLEGNPCLVSSVCVLAGFAIFLASEFGINRTFGMYMLISLFFGLVGDLVYLPALIRQFPWILGSTPKGPGANLDLHDKENEQMKKISDFPRAAASVVLLVTASALSAQAAPDANTILKTVASRMNSKDEAAKIKMKVVESNGTSKERQLEIKRKSGAKQQVLVRLQAPADVSGIALLSVSSGKSEDQWIYMPSQKKARRVVSGNKSQKFLDTEFSLEDFSANTYGHFTNKILKEERAPSASVAVVESQAKDKATSYSKILTWVDLNSYQVQKSEYYDQDGKLLKTMVFRNYKKFGETWRAQNIEVRNMQNHRSTLLQVASMKVNAGLNDREFTQSALEED